MTMREKNGEGVKEHGEGVKEHGNGVGEQGEGAGEHGECAGEQTKVNMRGRRRRRRICGYDGGCGGDVINVGRTG